MKLMKHRYCLVLLSSAVFLALVTPLRAHAAEQWSFCEITDGNTTYFSPVFSFDSTGRYGEYAQMLNSFEAYLDRDYSISRSGIQRWCFLPALGGSENTEDVVSATLASHERRARGQVVDTTWEYNP